MKNLFLILLITSLLMAPYVAKAQLKIDDSLLIWFQFNEGEGNVAKDSSGHGNDGNIEGDFTWVDSKDGAYKTALQFKTNVHVRAPYVKLNHQSHTVEMWINPNLSGDQQLVFSQKDTNTTNKSAHYRVYNTGVLRMGYYGNDLDTAAGVVSKGQWAHIAFWHDADKKERKIFVNGEMKGNDSGKALYEGVKGDTVVGSWTDSGQFFDGIIDEFRLWNRPLSDTEIKDAMILPTAVHPQGKLTTTWGGIKKQ